MLSLKKKMLMSGARPIRPQDVFATSLYTGNGGTQTITNGLDLAGKGGLVWIKARNAAASHRLIDTERGPGKRLASNTTDAEENDGTSSLTQFLSNGFRVQGNTQEYNENGRTLVAWAWREARKFFVKLTYTGNGQSGRQIPHGLGDVPGMIVVKARSLTNPWAVYHRSIVPTSYLRLNGTDAAINDPQQFGATPSASTFTVGSGGTNANGVEYVAYLFAHNPDLIDCGSYVGTGSAAGPMVTCGKGWTPQFLITKGASEAGGGWVINDAVRGLAGAEPTLTANQSAAESATNRIEPTATGFQPVADSGLNTNGITYVYLAIRAPT